MRYDAEVIGALTCAEVMEAIHPCEVTHNLLRAIDSMRQVVERRGRVFEDEQLFRPLYADIANQASTMVQGENLGYELDALKSTRLHLNIWRHTGSALIHTEPLNVSSNLAITLRAVYTELLRQIAMFAEGKADKCPS